MNRRQIPILIGNPVQQVDQRAFNPSLTGDGNSRSVIVSFEARFTSPHSTSPKIPG